MSTFATTLASWHEFYVLVGEGAATLIGLMFVAVTFGANRVTVETAESTRAFLDPTITHFVQVFVTACLVVAPTMQASWLGGALVILGVSRLFGLVKVHRTLRHAQRKSADIELSDWMSNMLVPCAIYLSLLGSGIAFLLGHNAFGIVAIATVVTIVNGILSAWELLIWLAFERAKAAQKEP